MTSLLAPIAKRLEGKVALITGGASGIGECSARLFAQHGAKVLIADIQDDLGHSLCKEIGLDHQVSYVHCDVASESQVQNAVNTAVKKYGKLDIMFNNAGISGSLRQHLLETDHEDLKRVFDVNVVGGFLGAKYAAKVMIPQKKGSIIFTSSLAAVTSGFPYAYAVSKHAQVGLAKNLCVELGKYGIRVNCIAPFGVATPLTVRTMHKEKSDLEDLFAKAANLKGTVMEAEDVAQAAVFLGSDESKYISGLNLPIDGGYSTTNVALAEAMKHLR